MQKYRAAMERFSHRDFKQERANTIEQINRLSMGSQVSSMARKGNSILQKARAEIDQNMIEKLRTKPEKVQMSLLNDYLNCYTEKLARANAEAPSKINIDKQLFIQIVKEVNSDTYNPYVQVEKLKDEANELTQQSRLLRKTQKRNPLIEEQARQKEEAEFKKEL